MTKSTHGPLLGRAIRYAFRFNRRCVVYLWKFSSHCRVGRPRITRESHRASPPKDRSTAYDGSSEKALILSGDDDGLPFARTVPFHRET